MLATYARPSARCIVICPDVVSSVRLIQYDIHRQGLGCRNPKYLGDQWTKWTDEPSANMTCIQQTLWSRSIKCRPFSLEYRISGCTIHGSACRPSKPPGEGLNPMHEGIRGIPGIPGSINLALCKYACMHTTRPDHLCFSRLPVVLHLGVSCLLGMGWDSVLWRRPMRIQLEPLSSRRPKRDFMPSLPGLSVVCRVVSGAWVISKSPAGSSQ